MNNKLTYKIQDLIANGKTEQAIKTLLSYLIDKSDLYLYYIEMIKVSGFYKKKINDFNLGLNEFDSTFNKINDSILRLVKRIESKELDTDSLIREKISTLLRKLFMTNDSLEIKKIRFELDQLKKHSTDEFLLNFLDEELTKLDIKDSEIKLDRNLTFMDKLKIDKSVNDFLSCINQ